MLPIGRYVYNRTGNDNPQLRWGQNSLSYGGKTLRYADVTTLAFYFHHDVRYVNLVKNDDTLGYEIRINDLVLERRNSAFIRATASSKGMPPASKLETPLPTIFKYPLATMRLQMAFGSHSRSG